MGEFDSEIYRVARVKVGKYTVLEVFRIRSFAALRSSDAH